MNGKDSDLIPLQYDSQGLIPVIAQDQETKDVLMMAYANQEAVDLTRTTGYAHYFSRSRNTIWKKGEESGNLQKVSEIRVDCDADTIIYIVSQQCAACHTGHWTCFYRTISGKIIADRLFEPNKVYNKRNE